MALITDAIDNKVATVDWLYNRLKTDGTGISNVEYTMNITIRVGNYSSSAKVTYVIADYVPSGTQTIIGITAPYYVYKVKSITNKTINANWTPAQLQQATVLWNKIIKLYLPANASVSTGSTSVKSAFKYYDDTGTIGQVLALSNLCTSTTTAAYIFSISIPSSGGIVPNGAIYFVNHSGVELGGNYIGGSKSTMFVDNNGDSIPNNVSKGVTYQQFDTLGGGSSSSKQCVTESGVASLIKENTIMPVIGTMYTTYKGPNNSSNNMVDYAKTTSSNTKIIPPWTTGLDMLTNNGVVNVWARSFLYTNSSNIFTKLGQISYNSFSNTGIVGTKARAYFGNVSYRIPRTSSTAGFFEPLNEGWVKEGIDYGCYNTGSISLDPNEIQPGDTVYFYDSFSNRKPYLNPAILSGVTSMSPYIEHQVIKIPIASDISNLYYHPTLYNTKLTSTGYIITNVGVAAGQYNSAKIPIVIVPSSIAVDTCGDTFITVTGAEVAKVSANKITTKLGIYKYAFDASGIKTELGGALPSDVMDAIINAISNATCWSKSGVNNFYTNYGTVASKFNITYSNTETDVSITLKNKAWILDNTNSLSTVVTIYIKDIDLPNFRIGFSRTYSSTTLYSEIATVSVG
jgi:hypothetical protein